MSKYIVNQSSVVLSLYSILINKILVTECTTIKDSLNLNSMQKMSTQWFQQLIRFVFSKLIENLEKLDTRMNAKHSKTSKFKKIWHTNKWTEYNIRIGVCKYKVVERL